jgi:hypothetical protein
MAHRRVRMLERQLRRRSTKCSPGDAGNTISFAFNGSIICHRSNATDARSASDLGATSVDRALVHFTCGPEKAGLPA